MLFIFVHRRIKLRICPSTMIYQSKFPHNRKNINKDNATYECKHNRSTKCKASFRVQFTNGKADMNKIEIKGKHNRACCVKNHVQVDVIGGYEYEELEATNALIDQDDTPLLCKDVAEDMKVFMKKEATDKRNIDHNPADIYYMCLDYLTDKYGDAWHGITKQQAIELVRKARSDMGLGKGIENIRSNPQYSIMPNNKHFLQQTGCWAHPEKEGEWMQLAAFANPELIGLLKVPGMNQMFSVCDSFSVFNYCFNIMVFTFTHSITQVWTCLLTAHFVVVHFHTINV